MKASTYLVGLLGLALLGSTAVLHADDKAEAKGDEIKYDLHDGHFVKNTFKPKDNPAFLVITDRKMFDEVFGVAAVSGKRFNWVPKDAFEKKMVVAVITSGTAPVAYKLDKVTADDGTLYVQYEASKGSAGTATLASPLILSVDKDKIKKVVYIDKGKKAATVEVPSK